MKNLPVTKAFCDLRAGLAGAEREIQLARDPEVVLKIDQKLAALRKIVVAAGLGASADLDVFLLRMENKRKGGELLGELPRGRPTKKTQRVPFPSGLNKAEAYRWRLLRWNISQPEWDGLRETVRKAIDERGGDEVKWSQNQYIALARRNQPAPEPVSTPGFPDGPFRTIVIDPPWPMEKIVLERRPVERERMDYPTVALDEIEALPIERLADPRGAHVYLWTTHRLLPEGLRLFVAWGVRYECVLTWFKPTAQPLWWKYNTEHCLFGKLGSLPLLMKGEAVGFTASQQRHSHKPKEFFELIRRVSPEPRLTMYDDAREGFKPWGVIHHAA